VACCLAATGWENRVRIQQSFNLSQFARWIPCKTEVPKSVRHPEWIITTSRA